MRMRSESLVLITGAVLVTIGIGSVWQSRAGLVAGSIFIVIGAALVVVGLSRQRRRLASDGSPPRPLAGDIVLIAAAVLAGSAVYVGMLVLTNGS